MTFRYVVLVLFLFTCMFLPLESEAQQTITIKTSEIRSLQDSLFTSDKILYFKLTGRVNALLKDRGSNSSYHSLALQYLGKDSNEIAINIKAKTRGHFRKDKSNCKMPPILLNFANEETAKNTLFANQKKLKLVVPCQGDEYVIREWLVYKLYNLITDQSFRARLCQVDFEDASGKGKAETHYCFLLEDEKQMAARSGSVVWEKKMLSMQQTNLHEFEKMAVFEYMIGNTDWGVPYLQNIVLIAKDTLKAPGVVPYDFDHAGIVNASYAAPAQELGIPSILTRLYRGFCESDMNNFAPTFDLFNQLKDEFYKVYADCPLLSAKYVKFATGYLDDFYKTINKEKKAASEFGLPCREKTHVEIRGLKK